MTMTPATTEPTAPIKLRRASGGGGGFSETEIDPPAQASIFVPMRFHRRGGRRIIVMPERPADAAHAVDVKTLPVAVLALARAHRWRRKVEAGEVGSGEELARRLGLTSSYVSRVLRLTLLAPDIVEAILEGREPSGFSLDAISRADLPTEWPAQRRMFGFPAIVR
jgi:ParB-like chromosome segregation protein Spo0J